MVKECIPIFKAYFPFFVTFGESGEDYKRREDRYKREASGLMKSLFQDWIKSDSGSQTDDYIRDSLQTVLFKKLPVENFQQNLSNWRENDFINKTVMQNPSNFSRFKILLHELLKKAYIEGNIAKELDELIEFLKSINAKPALSKSFPTLILFLWNPDRYIFIKPTAFDQFFELSGMRKLGRGKYLTGSEYNRVLKNIQDILIDMSELRPRDMIDIQTFYYVITSYSDEDVVDDIEIIKIRSDKNIPETEKQALIQSRLGQGRYRKALLRLWKSCAVTKCSNEKLLIASHIKPWSNCDNKDRLNPNNGLILSPNIDHLFDKGFITFGDDGQIIISEIISESDQRIFGIDNQSRIFRDLNVDQKKYLSFHRKSVFIGSKS